MISTQGPSELSSYTYDQSNHLTAATEYNAANAVLASVAYAYDAFGRLVQCTATAGGSTTVERYGYDADGNVWADLDGSNNLTARRVYGDGVDEPVAWVSAGGAVAWYHADLRGSVVALTNGAGVLEELKGYDAFGNVMSDTNPAFGDRFGYTGTWTDPLTGLQYNRARWYDPATGRFTSEDPSGFAAGDPNVYRYVNNGPTNYTDPSGLQEQGGAGGPPRISFRPLTPEELQALQRLTPEQRAELNRQAFDAINEMNRRAREARRLEIDRQLNPDRYRPSLIGGINRCRATGSPFRKPVSAWGDLEKVMEVIGRALPQVPEVMAERLRQLFSPAGISLLVALLAAHASFTPVAVTADAIGLILAAIFIGKDTIDVGNHLGDFLYAALHARSEDDLNEAATHLAEALGIAAGDALTVGAARAARAGMKRIGSCLSEPAPKGPAKPSPRFRPPTNPPQLPPITLPPGLRIFREKPTQQYPNGHWKIEKWDGQGWQRLDPRTMKPGPHPDTHVPFPPGYTGPFDN